MPPRALRVPLLLSVAAAVVTMGLKFAAYFLTHSAGLLADALESAVNLLAAGVAYASLAYASRPADPDHAYGHEKIEFFSSGVEGILVAVAGAASVAYAVVHLLNPPPLGSLGLGAALAGAAAAVNLVVGLILLRVGRKHHSIILEADGHHLMTDVWATAAVVVGLWLVHLTGRPELDALAAALVGLGIVRVGVRLVRRSYDGLMDRALPPAEVAGLRAAIAAALPAGATFHLLRTRRAGRRKFADFHLLVDGGATVRDGHRLAHEVEAALHRTAPELEVTVHLEPIDERGSWEAVELARLGEPPEPDHERHAG